MQDRRMGELKVAIDFGLFRLETRWVPDERQRDAAWALYVELATRIATQELDLDSGVLREAMDSLHALFAVTREVLRKDGPVVGMGPDTVGGIAVRVLNFAVRPFLGKWHPRLADWEARRAPQATVHGHELAW